MTVTELFADLLRPSDELKVVLEATLVSHSNEKIRNSKAPNPATLDGPNRRVLGIVCHKDDWNLSEEGGLFVCKYKAAQDGHPEGLEVQRIFPIYGQFAIEMGQLPRSAQDVLLDLSTKVGQDQPKTRVSIPAATLRTKNTNNGSAMSLTITPADGVSDEAHSPTFITYDVKGLGTLASEYKRLKGASGMSQFFCHVASIDIICVDIEATVIVNLAQSTTYFSWLKPYFTKRVTVSALTTLAQDLRVVNLPLVERLSPASAGIIGDDHADLEVIREEWILTQARERCRRGKRSIKLRLGTFNVNGKLPSQDLSDWVQGRNTESTTKLPGDPPSLPAVKVSPLSLSEYIPNPFDWVRAKPKSTPSGKQSKKEHTPLPVSDEDPNETDIIVLGFQELDLSTEALIYSTSTAREDAWTLAVFAALGEKAVKYEKLASKQLVGMLIMVIVKKSLSSCFTDVKVTSAGAGILGVMGNKGGTAIRLTFSPPKVDNLAEHPVSTPGSTTFTFVNAHLAAFDEMFEKRNSDFQDLSRRLTFEAPVSDVTETGEDGNELPSTLPAALTPYMTDALFWMGDLNYRIDVADHELRRTLRDDEWENPQKFEALLRFDQLKAAIKAKKAFVGFSEAPITHLPTYRFSPGLGMDKLGFDLKRKPAWTDRILYMHGTACSVHQLNYTGHPQITMSDHRPVAADFAVDVDYYDANDYKDTIKKLFDQVEHIDDGDLQKGGGLKLDETIVDFGKIFYARLAEKEVKVKNTGEVPCAFRFVPVQQDAPIHPDWLQVHPMTGVLLPGHEVTISLKVYVDNVNASVLNLEPKGMSGTLILHTALGKDHFISISGEYQYTCFANTQARLTRLKGPIRSLKSPDDLLPESKALSAPREIKRLVNWMMTNAGQIDDLFVAPADEADVDRIHECLDTGAEFSLPDATSPRVARAFAVTLIRFLDSLVDPVIPSHIHPSCRSVTSRDEAFEILDGMPPAAVNIWISITSFLHFICQSSEKEEKAQNIAAVLAPILLRDDSTSAKLPISPHDKQKFLLYFFG